MIQTNPTTTPEMAPAAASAMSCSISTCILWDEKATTPCCGCVAQDKAKTNGHATEPLKTNGHELSENTEAEESFFTKAALALSRRGLPVIPLQPLSKSGMLGDQFEAATTDPEQIRRWGIEFANANVGVVAKRDGYCILDEDYPGLTERIERETEEKLPRTYTVKSAGKGLKHLYFSHTDYSRSKVADIPIKAKSLFDFQNHNRYIVGAGSKLDNGRNYDVLDDSAIVPIPDWLVDWLATNADISHARKSTGARPVVEDFDFDHFCEWYDLEFIGEDDGKHILKACPFKGTHHTKEHGKPDYKAAVLFWDGETLGFKCLATSCEGSNYGIGGLKGSSTRTATRSIRTKSWKTKAARSL